MKKLIEWLDERREEKNFKCLVCGDSLGAKILQFCINSSDAKRFVYKCQECSTFCYDDPKIDETIYLLKKEYSEEELNNVDTIYVEIDAGISIFAWAIYKISKNYKNASYLDIGCSYGFSLDYCKRALGWDVCGVEPSVYGLWGKRDLGLNIYNGFSWDIDEIKGKKFNVVFSSEVIEHVENPLEFINHVKSFLSDDGCLILTTPNGDFIDKNTNPNTIFGLMFPGNHYFVTNSENLKKMLISSGFKYVETYFSGHSIVSYASMKKIDFAGEEEYIESYLNYLFKRTHSQEIIPDYLFRGFAARAIEDHVNLSKLEKAEEVLKIIYIKIDIEDCIKNFESHKSASMKIPFFLPLILYYEGILRLNLNVNYARATYLFGESFRLIDKLASKDFYSDTQLFTKLLKLSLLKELGVYHYLLSKVFMLISRPESNEFYCLFSSLPDEKKEFIVSEFLKVIPRGFIDKIAIKNSTSSVFKIFASVFKKTIFSILKKIKLYIKKYR
jgi:2-polyprenyl-3-methyl-5-hydroxy-6-metoxy-1,4-benzoquinol methylase